jgi:hypothetical protein
MRTISYYGLVYLQPKLHSKSTRKDGTKGEKRLALTDTSKPHPLQGASGVAPRAPAAPQKAYPNTCVAYPA